MNIVYVLICVNRTVLPLVPVTAALMVNEIRRVLLLGLQKEVGAIWSGLYLSGKPAVFVGSTTGPKMVTRKP